MKNFKTQRENTPLKRQEDENWEADTWTWERLKESKKGWTEVRIEFKSLFSGTLLIWGENRLINGSKTDYFGMEVCASEMCAGKYTHIGQASTSGDIYPVIWDRVLTGLEFADHARWLSRTTASVSASQVIGLQTCSHLLSVLRGCEDWTQFLMLVWQTLYPPACTPHLSTEEWMTQ